MYVIHIRVSGTAQSGDYGATDATDRIEDLLKGLGSVTNLDSQAEGKYTERYEVLVVNGATPELHPAAVIDVQVREIV